jgi:hypothetical protein
MFRISRNKHRYRNRASEEVITLRTEIPKIVILLLHLIVTEFHSPILSSIRKELGMWRQRGSLSRHSSTEPELNQINSYFKDLNRPIYVSVGRFVDTMTTNTTLTIMMMK